MITRLLRFGLLAALVLVTIAVSRSGLVDGLRGATAPAASIESPSPFRALVVLPEDGPESIIGELESARYSIDLYVYLLPSDEILSSLSRAHARGVTIRVILERDPFGGGNSNQASFDRLQAMGIRVKWADDQFRFIHIKMMLVDGTTALIMTFNLAHSALTQNREFAVVTTEPADVSQVTELFEADWAGDPFVSVPPLVTSPDNSRLVTSELIDAATVSVDIYAEVIRDGDIRASLIRAAQNGVRVRILVPQSPAGDDQLLYRELTANGIEIRLLADVYSHAKAIVVDGNRAFVGSQNLTGTSLDENRELGIILTDSANLARLNAVFEADWANSPPF